MEINPIKRISEWIRQKKDAEKQERTALMERELRDSISIEERYGYLWILCNGVAVSKVLGDSTVEVTCAIAKMRDNAVEFKFGNHGAAR